MNNTPLISIILPIYNIEKYLPKCMESILCQTYKNLEIIMVDDGSTDNCAILCDSYKKKDSRIVVYHKYNGGLSDARNYGIQHANGLYITCIDPDDYVDSDYVEYLYNLTQKYNVHMSICQHRVHYDNGLIKEYGKAGNELLTAEKCIERMLYHDIIDTSAWAKLYHRSLFEYVHYPKNKLFEDIGTTYKLMMQCSKIAVGYESKYNYIFHENSIVNSKFNPKKLDLLEMTDLMATDVQKFYPQLIHAIRRRQVYARISTLNQMLDANNYDKERQEIISYIKQNTFEILTNVQAPKRDKIAIFLLTIHYSIYKLCWKIYRKTTSGN